MRQKIEQMFLDVLDLVFTSIYLSPESKIIVLSRAIAKLDSLKFFTQLAWESKIIATSKYSDLITKLEEVGRQLGGWEKGLQKKTLANKQREK